MKKINIYKWLKVCIVLPIILTFLRGCIDYCSKCDDSERCISCVEGFEYDPTQNSCVSFLCQDQLLLQTYEDQVGDQQQQCVSICEDSFLANKQSRVCERLKQCSSSFYLQIQSSLRQDGVKEIILYKQDYLLVFYSKIVDQVRKSNGQLELSLAYGNNSVKWQVFMGEIFIFYNDNSINKWDIEFDIKQPLIKFQLGQTRQDSVIIKADEYLGCYITFNLETSIIFLYPFLNLSNQQIIQNPIALQLPFINSKYFIKDNYIYLNYQNVIQIFGISSDANLSAQIQMILECHYTQNSSHNIIDIIFVKEFKTFYFTLTDLQGIAICNQQGYQIMKSQQQATKINQFLNQQNFLILLVQFQSKLHILNPQNQFSEELVLSQQGQLILDFQIIQVNESKIELYLLLDNQQIEIYTGNTISTPMSIFDFKFLESKSSFSNTLANLLLISSVDQSIIYLAAIGNGFQIFDRSNNSKFLNQPQLFLFSAFATNPYIQTQTISDILIIEDFNYILTCSIDGSIFIWDVTHQYKSQLFSIISYANDQCQNLYRLSQNIAIANFYNRIVFINLTTGIASKILIKQNPNSNSEKIYCNNDKAAIIYDQVFQLLDMNLNVLIQTTQADLNVNVKNIYLNEDLTIIIQQVTLITIFQLDPSQTQQALQIKQLYQYDSGTDQILFTKIKQYPKELQQQLGYLYEIIMYNSRQTLFIFDNMFNTLTQIDEIPLSAIVDIQFSPSAPQDPYYFALGISNQKASAFKYKAYSIKMGLKSFNQVLQMAYSNGIMAPRIIQSKLGNSVKYELEAIIPLPTDTVLILYRYDPISQTNINYVMREFLGEVQSAYKSKTDSSAYYIGTKSGQVAITPLKENYSQLIYEHPTKEIINLQQSYKLGLYFVISKKIQIVNIHNNIIQEEIIFEDKIGQYVQGFQLFEDKSIIIAFKSSQLILKNFQKKEFLSYTKIQNILSYFLLNEIITLCGQKILQLDMNLIEISKENQIDVSGNPPQICSSSQKQLYCKLLDSSLIVFDRISLSIIAEIQNQIVGSSYSIFIDEEMDNLILYYTDLYVYSLIGIRKNKQVDLNKEISSIQIYGDKLCIIAIQIISRDNLIQEANFITIGGGQIQRMKYIKEIKCVAIWTNVVRFSQLFIYSLETLSMLHEIRNTFTQNDQSIVVDVSFDLYQNYIVYLDLTGNLNYFSLYDGTIGYNLKMVEFVEENNPPIGINIDFDFNNIFIYNSNSIYQINYSQLCRNPNRLINYKKNQFFQIDSPNPLLNNYFFIDSNNILYKYQDRNFNFIYYFQEQEGQIGVQYLSNQDILIVGSRNKIYVYHQLSSSNFNFQNREVLLGYQFKEFITDGIFITYDESLVDYDFQNKKENYAVSFGPQARIVHYLILKSANLSIIGLNQGDCIFYDFKLKQFQKQTIDISNQSQILFIKETQNYFWVCSIQGRAKQYSKANQQEVNQFDLKQQLQLTNSNKIGLFEVDEENSRIITNVIGQKMAYVIDYSQNPYSIQNTSFPHNELCQILITNSYILFYSNFQINIHNRKSLAFLKSLKRLALDDIQQLYFWEEQFIILAFLGKYEIFFYDKKMNEIKMIDQEVTKFPQIVSINIHFYQSDSFLQVILISQNLFIEKRYTLDLITTQQSNCGVKIQVYDYLNTEKQLSWIFPTMLPIPNWISMVKSTSDDTDKRQYYLNLKKGDLSLINSKNIIGGSFVISSGENVPILVEISQESFLSYLKSDLNLRNLQFSFKNKNENIEQIFINFSNSIKNIRFQNIIIAKQNNLRYVQFNFVNLQSVVLQEITIDGNKSLNYQRRELQSSGVDSTNITNGFFYFESCESVYLYFIKLQNVSFSQQNFKSVFSFKKIKKLVIDTIQIDNIESLISMIQIEEVEEVIINNLFITNSKFSQQTNSQQIINKYQLQILGCLSVTMKNITFSQNTDLLFLSTSKMLSQENSDVSLKFDQILIQKATISNNTQSQVTDELIIIKISSSIVILNTLDYFNNQGNIQISQSQSVQIIDNKYKNNNGVNGGAISFIQNNQLIQITNTLFTQNIAKGSGGALYFKQEQGEIIIDNLTQITNNSACIGGGIRLYSSSLDKISLKLDKKIFQNNIGEIYGNNFATFVKMISISSVNYISDYTNMDLLDINQQSKYSGQLELFSFKSGDTAYLQVTYFDEEDRIVSFSVDKVNQGLYQQDILEEIKSYSIQISSKNIQQATISGENFINYNKFNEKLNMFIFNNFNILSIPQSQQELVIDYEMKPSSIEIISLIPQKPIFTIIHFRECKIGEIFKLLNDNITTCQQCQYGTYSLVNPSSQEYVECQKCPYSASYCEGNQILLREGYWRKNNQTDEIVFCENNPSVCQEAETQNGCKDGYIGPLCEVCDNLGDVWKGKRYGRQFGDLHSCLECNSTQLSKILIIISIIFYSIYFFVSLSLFIKSFQHIQTCYYLRMLQILPISKSEIKDQSTFFFKILTNYLQISTLILSFADVSLPDFFTFIPNFFGQPSSNITTGLDCVVTVKQFKEFGKLQFITFIQVLTPLFFLFLLLGILQLCINFKLLGVTKNHRYILICFLLIFFQPNQVTLISKLFMCRRIGGSSYVSEDLTLECDDASFNRFVKIFAIPLLIVWVSLPIFIFKQLYKKKNNLSSCQSTYRYGFFYLEFKRQFYYWEFVRIYLKIVIGLIFTFYRSNFILTYLLIQSVLFLYIKLIIIKSPFKFRNLQKFEIFSYQILIINTILSIFKITNSNIAFEIMLCFFHYSTIACQIMIIIFYKINNQFNILGKFFRWIIKHLPRKYYIKLVKYNQINFKTFQRWKMIKQNLTHLIAKKAADKLEGMQAQTFFLRQSQIIQQFNSQQTIPTPQQRYSSFHQQLSNYLIAKQPSQNQQYLTKLGKKYVAGLIQYQESNIEESPIEESNKDMFQSNPIKDDLDENKNTFIFTPSLSPQSSIRFNRNLKVFTEKQPLKISN